MAVCLNLEVGTDSRSRSPTLQRPPSGCEGQESMSATTSSLALAVRTTGCVHGTQPGLPASLRCSPIGANPALRPDWRSRARAGRFLHLGFDELALDVD